MPTFKAFMHGNLPVDVEIDRHGDLLGISVETKAGTVFLDMSAEEESAFMEKHSEKAFEAIKKYWIDRADYERSIRDD